MEPWCKEGKKWLKQLTRQIVETTGDVKSKHFLMQRIISMAIQRGNSASMPDGECLDNNVLFLNPYMFRSSVTY